MPGNVQAVQRAAAILTLLARADRPVMLSEVASTLSLPKSTAHGLLSTLRSIGWVEQPGTHSGYRVARHLTGLAQGLDAADLRSAATPWMDQLASETGLEVHLTKHERGQALLVQHVYRPDNTRQRMRAGETLPLHATAGGKVLLAHGTPGSAPSQALEQFTRFTLGNHDDLDAELARVRRDGHAVESGEFYPDTHAVAVPVCDSLGAVVGALAVIGRRDEVLERSVAARAPLAALGRAAGFISRAVVSQA